MGRAKKMSGLAVGGGMGDDPSENTFDLLDSMLDKASEQEVAERPAIVQRPAVKPEPPTDPFAWDGPATWPPRRTPDGLLPFRDPDANDPTRPLPKIVAREGDVVLFTVGELSATGLVRNYDATAGKVIVRWRGLTSVGLHDVEYSFTKWARLGMDSMLRGLLKWKEPVQPKRRAHR